MSEQPNKNPIEKRLEQGWDILKQTTNLGGAIETGNKIFNAMPEQLRGKEKKTVVQRTKEVAEKLSTTIEKKRAENNLDQIDRPAGAPEAAQVAPAAQGLTFIDKMSNGFDRMQNFLAFHMAPIMELLQKINLPIFGNMKEMIDTAMLFLGMERTLMFGAIRKNKIEPAFHSEDPAKDSKSVEEMIAMAKSVHVYNENYSTKEFFEEAAGQFAKTLTTRKTFYMEELVDFTKKNVVEKQKQIAINTRPTEERKPLLKLEGKENEVTIVKNEKRSTFKTNERNEFTYNDKKLKVTLKGNNVVVKKLAIEGGNIMMTTDQFGGIPLPIDPERQNKFVTELENSRPYKETFPLLGELIITTA